jgi:hypothetical protein
VSRWHVRGGWREPLEALQAENARLRRDLTTVTTKRDELQAQKDAANEAGPPMPDYDAQGVHDPVLRSYLENLWAETHRG